MTGKYIKKPEPDNILSIMTILSPLQHISGKNEYFSGQVFENGSKNDPVSQRLNRGHK